MAINRCIIISRVMNERSKVIDSHFFVVRNIEHRVTDEQFLVSSKFTNSHFFIYICLYISYSWKPRFKNRNLIKHSIQFLTLRRSIGQECTCGPRCVSIYVQRRGWTPSTTSSLQGNATSSRCGNGTFAFVSARRRSRILPLISPRSDHSLSSASPEIFLLPVPDISFQFTIEIIRIARHFSSQPTGTDRISTRLTVLENVATLSSLETLFSLSTPRQSSNLRKQNSRIQQSRKRIEPPSSISPFVDFIPKHPSKFSKFLVRESSSFDYSSRRSSHLLSITMYIYIYIHI